MGQRNEARLADLLAQVNRARTSVQAERKLRSASRDAHRICCGDLAAAMEAYADAATDAGIPLPYRYRDEMRLYRSLASR
jgi:hypothetical protein